MGFRGSEVQILSSRPVISRAYGDNRKPFFCFGTHLVPTGQLIRLLPKNVSEWLSREKAQEGSVGREFRRNCPTASNGKQSMAAQMS
jgi:hypothetical protein